MKGRSKVLVFVLMGQGIQQDHLSYQVRKAKGLRDRLLWLEEKTKATIPVWEEMIWVTETVPFSQAPNRLSERYLHS